MFSSVTLHVVKSEEPLLGLGAASAGPPVGRAHLLAKCYVLLMALFVMLDACARKSVKSVFAITGATQLTREMAFIGMTRRGPTG